MWYALNDEKCEKGERYDNARFYHRNDRANSASDIGPLDIKVWGQVMALYIIVGISVSVVLSVVCAAHFAYKEIEKTKS